VKTRKKFNINKLNLFLDMALALIFVVEMEEHFTGLHFHELLGLFITAVFVAHITLHWRWVAGVTKQFFHNLFSVNKARLKYMLNLILFIDMATCIVTGILISRTLGLNFAFAQQIGMVGHSLHILTAQLALILVGLHIASSWEWLALNMKKYLFNFSFLQKQLTSDDHAKDIEGSIDTKIPVSR
jgi:hypothetical protein